MKKIIFTAICTCSFLSYAQTIQFDKNIEQAILNEREGNFKTIQTYVKCDSVNQQSIAHLATIMEAKDGYLSFTISKNIVVLKHESWMNSKDILDVFMFAGLNAIIISNHEQLLNLD